MKLGQVMRSMVAGFCAAAVLASSPILAAASTLDTPEELVRSLYRAHQPWAGKEIDFDQEAVVARYFDEELTHLLVLDRQCAARSGEICNLDFDPILDAQDFENGYQDLTVKRLKSKPEVVLDVRFTNLGTRKMLYHMRKTQSGWRISDVEYAEGHSLKSILSAPLP